MTLTPSLPDVMAWPGAWGFLGAVVYGAPKLLACVCSTAADHPRAGQCTAEAIVALIIGTIAATAFEGQAGFNHRHGCVDGRHVPADRRVVPDSSHHIQSDQRIVADTAALCSVRVFFHRIGDDLSRDKPV